MKACVYLILLALTAALMACTQAPLRTSVGSVWQPSPNFDERRPNFVVIHHTSDATLQTALDTLTDPVRQVSAHYLVSRDGTILQLVDERQRAWHAGVSKWGNNTDLNSSSIGIELDNDGESPFAEAQIVALLKLLEDLKTRYRIPAANFIGHADVAPQRKNDPSRYFPWQRLAEHGFGLWCDVPVPAAPPFFDQTMALEALGYDVTDLDAATRAFRLHFVREDWPPPMEVNMLACLARLKARQ